jgi:predicted AAA+ superfamily ATPase
MRYLMNEIQQALKEKIVLLTGPRQCGKTTLARKINPQYDYLNFDAAKDRINMLQKK